MGELGWMERIEENIERKDGGKNGKTGQQIVDLVTRMKI